MAVQKFNVPSIGDTFRLWADWTFPCFREHRNAKFIEQMRPDVPLPEVESVAITIPAGAILAVQRIYIRSGKKAWDSITFSLKALPTDNAKKPTKKASGRFWAKLEDVNEIQFTAE